MSENRSLILGLTILENIISSDEGVLVTDITKRCGIHKSTASRLLMTLAHCGYAEKKADSGRYVIGPSLIRIVSRLPLNPPLRDIAKPYIKQLVDQTGETVHMAVHYQGRALYIEQLDSPKALRVSTSVGTLAPLHCTALGKILLAYGGIDSKEKLEQFTPRTMTNKAALTAHIDQVKKKGYAIDDEEFQSDVRCIAVPIFDKERFLCAIGISGPSSRLRLDNLDGFIKSILDVSKALSENISSKGYLINGNI